MESVNPNKIDSIELHTYTKRQLSIRDKIKLGIILKDGDYLELYDDIVAKFETIEDTEESIQKYIDYLNSKYNCTFKYSVIQSMISSKLLNNK